MSYEHDDVPRISFLGVPVYGDFDEPGQRKEQKPLSELQPLLQAVLDDEGIGHIGWTQYTPYFNDGDPCVFSVHAFWANPPEDATKDDEDYRDTDYGLHSVFGYRDSRWDADTRKYVDLDYDGPDEARYDRLVALKDAIEGGHFENVLLAAFGDHAEVTVRKDRIDVDHYSHD